MKHVFTLTLTLALLASAPALADGRIDVMTQNQYLGADLNPVIGAGSLEEFIAAAQEALGQAAANNFPERAEALAQLIANRSPDVVGLQEVFNFTFDAGAGPQNGPPPFVDHLSATLNALAALGEPYVAVAQVQNLNISVPGITIPGLGTVTVGVTDRDVILVRADLAGSAQPIPFSLACARPSDDGGPGCNYQAVAPVTLPPPFPPINIERGYVGIDITVDGALYRVVDTHLEVRRPNGNDNTLFFQALQAAELIQTLASFPNPQGANIVVVGDINSSPEDPIIPTPQPTPFPFPAPFDQFIIPPYTQFVGSGYTDTWTLRPGADTSNGYVQGLSCCQFDDLSNQQSNFYERIDMIFSMDVPSKVKKARVLGGTVADKTPPPGLGLWPADHGSVAAELQFE